jgi:hypothetical protein
MRTPVFRVAGDLGLWAAEGLVRGAFPPENPEVLRLVASVAWRFEPWRHPGLARAMWEEARRSFGLEDRAAGQACREANDLQLQARLEALVVPHVPPDLLPAYVEVRGEAPSPSLILFPRMGAVLTMVSALGARLPGLVAWLGRRAPAQGPLGRALDRRHADERRRLPVRWEHEPDAIAGHLAAGRPVCAAFDDRGWGAWRRVRWLGRPANLSPRPWAVAQAVGVPVIPASVHRERDKAWTVELGAPLNGGFEADLRDWAEPLVRSFPGHYLPWLAECRRRGRRDPAPLFADYPTP